MVKVGFRGGKEFAVQVRDHVLTCDRPVKVGGADRGPAPAEWLAAALGSCIGYYVLDYLESRKLPTDGLELDVGWEMANSPRRIGKVRVGVTLPGDIPEKHHDRILRAAKHCMIHNTLHQAPEVDVSVGGVVEIENDG